MNCLSLERLYAYLEGELSSAESRDIEGHFAACRPCRVALEERRRLLQAIETLPAFEVPPDFAKGVTDRISVAPAKAKVSFVRWIAAAVAGFLAFVAVLSVIALVTGQNFFQFFIRFNRGLWPYIQEGSLVLAKFAKLIVLFLNVVGQLLGELLETLGIFTSLIRPEAQVFFICASFLLILAGGFLWRKKFLVEKNHEI
jgi:hypothetical protein